MSNVITELSEQPPAGSPILLTLGSFELEGVPLWNVTGWYFAQFDQIQHLDAGNKLSAVVAHADRTKMGEGFKVAFSISTDDLTSGVHTAYALALYFGCPGLARYAAAGDALADLRLDEWVVPRTPEETHPGTGLRQPSIQTTQTLGGFIKAILPLTGEEPVAAPEPEPEPEPEPIVVPPEAPIIQLVAGAMGPVTLTPVVEPAVKAVKPKASPKASKKSASSSNGITKKTTKKVAKKSARPLP